MPSKELELLRSGTLPSMVRWYDPRLLLRIWFRTIVSSVFGEYADRRLMQAATDPASPEELPRRYDFTIHEGRDASQRLAIDARTGTYWIDYIADTGDGFANTLAMAHILAQDELVIPAAPERLRHGDILIMGGDQCYPQATREEYKVRLTEPFSWAFEASEPTRKLFAIPGNHDWYDGLAAFDSLFCGSRDKLSDARNTANVIGGWRCQQHRSYWSLKLPHNWWIWGPDIQFSKYLDVSQVNYFESVARLMKPGDNLVICMAEPTWLLTELQATDDDENFYKITRIAREAGVNVRAAIAGDWHHYNRYYDATLDVHFITAGGGGAFMHPTHVLSDSIDVRWPAVSTTFTSDAAGNTVPAQTAAAQHYKIRLRNKAEGGGGVISDVREVVQDAIEPIQDIAGAAKPAKAKALRKNAAVAYPPKAVSRYYGLRNLLFPIYNMPFALGVGLIYWLITWQFYNVVEYYDISSGHIDGVQTLAQWWATYKYLPLYLMQANLYSISLGAMFLALFAACIWYTDATDRPGFKRKFTKVVGGSLHAAAHVSLMFALGFYFVLLNNWISPPVEREIVAISSGARWVPPFIAPIVREALEPLTEERIKKREATRRLEGPSARAAAPATATPGSDVPPRPARQSEIRKLLGLFLYPLEMVLIGGLAGGFLWGLYWVFTGFAFRMHAEEAYAALRIKDYKNFLRFKVEPGRLTIFPVGIDDMPREKDWMAPDPNQPLPLNNPKLVPKKPIVLRLIEDPIVIETGPARSS